MTKHETYVSLASSFTVYHKSYTSLFTAPLPETLNEYKKTLRIHWLILDFD